MTARPLRALVALAAAAVAVLLPASPAVARTAPPFPAVISLPDGFAPEGIDAGPGTTFYVGSLADGAIYRGDLRTGAGAVLAAGSPGEAAVGVFYEPGRDRLWVAGGPTGEVRVLDASTGALLATYTVPGPTFLNDVTVTREAAYVTDSVTQRLVVVPLGPGRALPASGPARELPLTGDIVYGPGFNANGIVATPDGRTLVVGQSNTGSLFRVDPGTGASTPLARGVTNNDGLELRGRTLYAVQNFSNAVAVVALDGDLTRGTVVEVLTDPALDVPATVTAAAGRLWAVNARFSTSPTPSTSYQVVQLHR